MKSKSTTKRQEGRIIRAGRRVIRQPKPITIPKTMSFVLEEEEPIEKVGQTAKQWREERQRRHDALMELTNGKKDFIRV